MKTITTVRCSLFLFVLFFSQFNLEAQVEDIVVDIPDPEFLDALVNGNNIVDFLGFGNYTGNADTNHDGLIQLSEALAIRGLRLGSGVNGITSLQGIETFVNMEILDIDNQPIMEIDLSTNTLLRHLEIRLHVSSINLTQCVNLNSLFLDYTQITELDLSGAVNLTNLRCLGNYNLTSINVSQNTALNYLTCTDNQLTSIDISNNLMLYQLFCADNQIETIQLPQFNNQLLTLDCKNNLITELDVSGLNALRNLNIRNNQLTAIDVSNNLGLRELNTSFNPLTSIDVSNNSLLESLGCSSNQLTSIDVSNNSLLESLGCSSNQLTSIDVSNNSLLESLACSSNQLTSIDVSSNSLLNGLYCANNSLEFINLKNNNNTNLRTIEAQNNPNLSCVQVDELDHARDMVVFCYYPYPFDEYLRWCFDLPLNDLFQEDCENPILSVEEFSKSSISFYPNPVEDVLSISNASQHRIQSVKIYSLQGQVMASKSAEDIESINLSYLSAGIFFCEIQMEIGTVTKKIVKK